MKLKLPTDRDRQVILGRTGSGKSLAGLYHLSRRSFDEMPWIIFDPKFEDVIARLKKEKLVEEIRLDKPPPIKPGLFVVHYNQDHTVDAHIEAFLHKIADNGYTGVYFDEGLSVPQLYPRYTAVQRLQTQGRSRHNPVITCSQRPTKLNRSVWSEADYFQYFGLTNKKDRQTLEEYAELPVHERPPQYHSWWWDVSRAKSFPLLPVPNEDMIMETFRARIGTKTRRFV